MTLDNMVADLTAIFPDGPSWPWRTQSARTVWQAVEAAIEKNPSLTPSQAIRDGFMATEVPAVELTPEDTNMLSLAARWKVHVVQPVPAEKESKKIVLRQTPKKGNRYDAGAKLQIRGTN